MLYTHLPHAPHVGLSEIDGGDPIYLTGPLTLCTRWAHSGGHKGTHVWEGLVSTTFGTFEMHESANESQGTNTQ